MNYRSFPGVPAIEKTIPVPVNDPDEIIAMIAEHQGFTVDKVLSRTRKRDVMFARHLVIYYWRRQCGLSFSVCGKRMGGRDHTTAMNSCQAIKDLLFSEEYTRDRVTFFNKIFRA